jgi:hypothetical protein
LIAAAVATRDGQHECGFLVAAVDDGRLAHLLDAKSGWIESDFKFVPGHWHYVASTFRAESVHAVVNTFVADLDSTDRTLRWVVRDRSVRGVPPASRLGIGKGFDGELAHAYPWPGSLDEVAIYDADLGRATLEAHLNALTAAEPADSADEVGAAK